MKIKPIVFSFAVSIILASAFLVVIFWVIYTYLGDLEATKSTLNTTGSFFGGVSTLGAAVVAAYLFNDWKIQHNKNIDWHFSKQSVDLAQTAYFDLVKSLRIIETIQETGSEECTKKLLNTLLIIQDLNDKSRAILPTITHFTTENEYNREFLPVIEKIIVRLEVYESVLTQLSANQKYKPGYEKLLADVDALCNEIILLYRQIGLKLSTYYRA